MALTFGFFFEPDGVVAFVGDAVAAIKVEDPVHDIVEEVAVVGDGETAPL